MPIKPYDSAIRSALIATAYNFALENEDEAYKNFHQVCLASKNAEHGVYQKLWQVMKCPINHPDFGRVAFHKVEGQDVPMIKKAEAIVEYITSIEGAFWENDSFQECTLGQKQSLISLLGSNESGKKDKKLLNIIRNSIDKVENALHPQDPEKQRDLQRIKFVCEVIFYTTLTIGTAQTIYKGAQAISKATTALGTAKAVAKTIADVAKEPLDSVEYRKKRGKKGKWDFGCKVF
ncbi:MAG TPA: hypothetical protein VLG49_08065 [Rhabdochlamydiaceae bacterium]|nr:hypothetical protein [Rhabdochlamydiaceae bacterium]